MSDAQQNTIDTSELIQQRWAKLADLRARGVAYPNDFRRDALAAVLHATYQDKTELELEATPVFIRLAGRIMTRRLMGKASFFHLKDMSGKIQVYVRQDEIP